MTTLAARALLVSVAVLGLGAPSWAGVPLLVPDNGSGSANLPPIGGIYTTPGDDLRIINGLPPGTTVEIDGSLHTFFYNPPSVYSFAGGAHAVGGSLGGDKWASDGTLTMPMSGTGLLAGFVRNIPVPLGFEIHAAPHIPGAPVQSFDTQMFRLFGQVTGDPDFDLLRIVGGNDFGLPSPGHTTLTQSGPNWAVDSFFDVTYRIDFVGHPGGALSGMSGSTTGTIRFQAGIPAPGAGALLGIAGVMAFRRRRNATHRS